MKIEVWRDRPDWLQTFRDLQVYRSLLLFVLVHGGGVLEAETAGHLLWRHYVDSVGFHVGSDSNRNRSLYPAVCSLPDPVPEF